MAPHQSDDSVSGVSKCDRNLVMDHHAMEPIAVVGLSLLFPQGIGSTDDLWKTMIEQRSTATPFPGDRMNINSILHPDSGRRGQIPVTKSHFLDQDLATFDAAFFATSTTDAAAMDPQQRLLLECTYRALENAGIPMEDVAGSQTSVYTGNFTNDWLHLAYKDGEQCETTTALGVQASFNANRISWFFNFQGNSANVDTACSSSLVCLDMACQGLRSRNENMSVVAGSNVIISPDTMHALTNLNMLSPDGQCYSFDHRANGYSRGEGVAVLILKRISDAVRDNDTIRGIIRSTGCNQDGHTPSITIPNHMSQERLICDTYKKASLSMTPTRYFEAHGTGTPVGDPNECRAIGAAFKQTRSIDDPLWIGALKSNIGHLEGASGIAGVIKAILVLEKATIPPNTNFEKVNPIIDTDFLRIKFPQHPVPWPVKGLRRASVNSFGNAGTNAHVILDDVYHYLKAAGLQAAHMTVKDPPSFNCLQPSLHLPSNSISHKDDASSEIDDIAPKLLVLSAKNANAVQRMSQEYAKYYSDRREYYATDSTYLDHLTFTLSNKRSALDWNAYAIVQSTKQLQDMDKLLSTPQKSLENPQLAFVFTGQGAQWTGMARKLIRYRVFRHSLSQSQGYLTDLCCSWLLDGQIFDPSNSRLSSPEISQPACTAVQLALIDLLSSLNVRPVAVTGHSSGEIAAAYCTGSISHKSAIRIAYHRGLLAASIAKTTGSRGTMMAVNLSKDEVKPYLKLVASMVGHCNLTIACVNSSKSVTISGPATQIGVLKGVLESEDVFARTLNVDVAYHSPYMQSISAAYLAKIQQLESGPVPPKPVIMISSVTGKIVSSTELLSSEYWVQNLVSPVLFADAMATLFSGSGQKIRKKLDMSHRSQIHIDAVMEVGPHSALRSYVLDAVNQTGGSPGALYVPILVRNHDADQTLLEALGFVKCLGYPVDIASLNQLQLTSKSYTTLSDLPAYVFDHSKQYWDESRLSKRYRTSNQGKHDLLGKPTTDWNELEPRWRNHLRVSEMPWMEEHVINGSLIYPGAGMIAMAIEAANQMSSAHKNVAGFELQEVTFSKALKVMQTPSGTETQFSIQLNPDDTLPIETWSRWRLFAYEANAWSECCHGMIRVRYMRDENEIDGHRSKRQAMTETMALRNTMRVACQKPLDIEAFYENFSKSGLGLGKPFQRIVSGGFNDQNQVIATIQPYEWPSDQYPQPHVVHPTTLDCIFHLGFVGPSEGGSKQVPTMIPTFLRNLYVSRGGLSYADAKEFHECAWVEQRDDRGAELGAIVVSPSGDQPLLEYGGLRITQIAQNTAQLSKENEMNQATPYHIEHRPDVDLLDTGYFSSTTQRTDQQLESSFRQYVDLLSHKRSGLDVLVLSTSTRFDLCQSVKSCWNNDQSDSPISSNFRSLQIFASSERFIIRSKEELQSQPSLAITLGDFQSSLTQQGLEKDHYDLILLPTHGDLDDMPLNQIRGLMKYNGKLIAFTHQESQNDTHASLASNGFMYSGLQVHDHSLETGVVLTASIHEISPKLPTETLQRNIYLITEPLSEQQAMLARCLTDFLARQDSSNTQTVSLEEALGIEASDQSTFIVLLESDGPVLYSLDQGRYEAVQKLLISASHVVWLNFAGGSDAGRPEYAMINGLARALRCEYERLNITTISLADKNEGFSQNQLKYLKLILDRNHSPPISASEDVEYLELNGRLNVSRVYPAPRIAEELTWRSQSQHISTASILDGPPLTLSIGSHGLLDTLRFTEDELMSQPLELDEVEVEVQAIGINFRDCLIALGRLPGGQMGQECAGTVIRAGTDTSFVKGDRVLMASGDLFKTIARCKAVSVLKIPESLSFTKAATIPAQFGTSWTVIHDIAKLQAGESILIHVGASGTGQAAIQIAQRIGATIYTTVSSERKKRLLMQEYGLPEEHILYSRDASFVDGIKRLTNKRGVDVVMNSLAGDLLLASWECIAPHGRFVEIGKKDIMANSKLPMLIFQRNASFHAFDHAVWFTERQREARATLEHLIALFAESVLRPAQPLNVRSMAEVQDMFSTIQSGTAIGKFVVEVRPETEVSSLIHRRPTYQLDSDARYVIAGGLGGIGRATARWLVERGARHLVLLSRYGPRTSAATELIGELHRQGVEVETPKCDITDAARIKEILGDPHQNTKPIKGCIQASIVAKDCLFHQLSFEDWKVAVDCKTVGSWNLHNVLPKGMDFFILLSSASGLAGIAGQANYDAANTYEDAFARYRTAHGEKTVAFDLGAMMDDGILAENPALRKRVLSYGSLEPIKREQYFAMLDYYCDPCLSLPTTTECQVGVGLSQGNLGSLESRTQGRQPMLRPLERMALNVEAAMEGSEVDGKRAVALSGSFDAAVQGVEQAIVQKLAKSLSVMQDESVDRDKPLQTAGVDSLLAIELRNWIAREFAADVAVFETQGASTLATLSSLVVGRSLIEHPAWKNFE